MIMITELQSVTKSLIPLHKLWTLTLKMALFWYNTCIYYPIPCPLIQCCPSKSSVCSNSITLQHWTRGRGLKCYCTHYTTDSHCNIERGGRGWNVIVRTTQQTHIARVLKHWSITVICRWDGVSFYHKYNPLDQARVASPIERVLFYAKDTTNLMDTCSNNLYIIISITHFS